MLIYDTDMVKVLRVSNTNRFLSDIRQRNVTQVVLGGKRIVVDPGIKRWFGEIITVFPEADEIWLTHYHPDHAWAAGYYAKFYGCIIRGPVVDHEILERPDQFLAQELECAGKYRDELFHPRLLPYALYFLNLLYGKNYPARINKFSGCPFVDVTVEYLAGHTTEEANFLLTDKGKRILVAGDLLQLRDGKATIPLNLPKSNLDSALHSLDVLSTMQLDVLVPGHGDIITGRDRIAEAIASAKRRYTRYRDELHEYLLQVEGLKSLKELAILVDFDWPKNYNPSMLERKCLAFAAWKAKPKCEFEI